MSRGPIHLHIDELVLHGFDSADRLRIADALQRELHVLVSRHGLPALWQSGPERIDAGVIRMSGVQAAAFTGTQIARAIHSSDQPVPTVEQGKGPSIGNMSGRSDRQHGTARGPIHP
jgi:hypothetical protein